MQRIQFFPPILSSFQYFKRIFEIYESEDDRDWRSEKNLHMFKSFYYTSMRSDMNWKESDHDKVDFNYLGIEKDESFNYKCNTLISHMGR